MTKISLFATAAMLAATPALAGGQKGALGVGAEYELSGIGGVSLNYDAGLFHLGGFLGYADPGGAEPGTFEIGGRFYYHIHSTAMSDFGVGGGLGIASIPVPGGMGGFTRDTAVFIEPSFQIRVFLASNVALSFTGGLTIGAVDASGVAITGQGLSGGAFSFSAAGGVGFLGGAGVHYYFF